jgi:hypothetical protein
MSQPKTSFRSGSCVASIFANTRQDGDRVYEQLAVSFQRRYRAKDGKWKSTTALGISDVPDAILVLQKVWEFARLKENNGK